jgi:hypothetical protein
LRIDNLHIRQRQKKDRTQNPERRILNLENSKHKNQNHNKIHSVKGVKMLFNRLFNLDLLDLKPCPTGRNDRSSTDEQGGIISYFGVKSRENRRQTTDAGHKTNE